MKLIARGAEAEILLGDDNNIYKQRVKKSYRHPELDILLRTERNRKEANILERARKANIPVPKLLKQEEFSLQMEHIPGEKIATLGTTLPIRVAKQLGEIIARMHDENIIHGDLTTSNMILQDSSLKSQVSSPESRIYLIDFGLGFTSTKSEDKAVDIHVFEEALEARHPINSERFFEEFCTAYKKISKTGSEVIKRLEKVQARGRNKVQV